MTGSKFFQSSSIKLEGHAWLSETWKIVTYWNLENAKFEANNLHDQFHPHPSGIDYLKKHSEVIQLELPGPHHLHMSNPEGVSQAVIDFLGLKEDDKNNSPTDSPPFEFKGL